MFFYKGIYFFIGRVYNVAMERGRTMSGKRCMFTGHRRIERQHGVQLSKRLDELIDRLVSEGYTDFCVGGAIGFDTVVALKVLEKKCQYEFIRLCLYLPCHNQDRGWSDTLKRAYYYVLKNADSVQYASEEYVTGCMQKRNRQMVDDSEICVAYCGSSSGGTAYTVAYAKKKGIDVINLY